MRNIRPWLAALIALVFAVAGTSALAAPEKQFTINVTTPASVSLGATGVPFSITVSNETPNGNSNTVSMKIYVPTGLTVTPVLPVLRNASDTASYPGTVSVSGQTISIKDLSPLKPQQSLRIKFNADVSATTCDSLTWTAQAWTGNSFGGDEFKFLTALVMAAPPFTRPVIQSTAVNGTSNLTISPAVGSTTSTLVNVAVPVSVTVTNSCLTNLSGIPVKLEKTDGTAGGFTSATVNTNASGVAAFSPTFTSIGTAELTASSSGYPSRVINVAVFDGTLTTCDTSADALADLPAATGSDGEFHSGSGGVTGYIAGLRGADKGGGCAPLQYTLTNNISGGSSTDPRGNEVPSGFYSFSFDPNAPNPVVGILSTYAPEWADSDKGLPARQTKVCTTVPCPGSPEDYPDDWTIVPACQGTAIAFASIPSGAPGACLASEGWVPKSGCLTADKPATGYQLCLQVTSIVIFGIDPVFGR